MTLLERIAHALELLDRHRGGAAEEVGDHEVGPVALRDVEHLGAHLDAGRRNRELLELEAFPAPPDPASTWIGSRPAGLS